MQHRYVSARGLSQLRMYSLAQNKPNPFLTRINKSLFDCQEQLDRVDPSSSLLTKFHPSYIQECIIGIKSFNLELSKISFGHQQGSSDKSKQFNNLKFEFWASQLEKLNKLDVANADSTMPYINEPSCVLLANSVMKQLTFDKSMFETMINSHKHFYNNNAASGFRDMDEMCSFGEGTLSQVNYLMQSVSLSPVLTGYSTRGIELVGQSSNEVRNLLSEICGHLGQASSICSFLIGMKYFAERKQVLMIPSDVLIDYDLSEELAIRLLLGSEEDTQGREKLKDCVFTMATRANDHVLTARSKLQTLKDTWKMSKLPDCIFLPMMNGLPAILYLEKLEKCDFDILSPKLARKEWRLPFRAWWAHFRSSF